MDLERFENSPLGDLVPISGSHEGKHFDHFAFRPHPLPFQIDLDATTWAALAEAMHALGRLDSAGKRLPNPRLVTRSAIRREAVSTSALEGTYTTLPQVFESELLGDEPKSRDVDEVLRFVRTAELGFELIRERPISQSLIKTLHARLMDGDPRCPDDEKGDFRKRQNFIGPRRAGIVNSFFVPPPPGDPVQDAMDDWVRWVRETDLPVLVRSAVGHYQFETIHPFFDGNGRLGRLLIVLQLLEEEKLSEPILEISTFLEDHRDEYQELLRRVSSTGDWNVWVGFFSEAVRSQSEQGLAKVDALLTYREEMMALLHENRVRGAAVQLADELIGSPVQVPARVADRLGITYQAALNSLERLAALGVLRRVDSSGRRRLYIASEVLTILEW
ncbi:MAG: Fic family protein [Actinomycetota bacterium]